MIRGHLWDIRQNPIIDHLIVRAGATDQPLRNPRGGDRNKPTL